MTSEHDIVKPLADADAQSGSLVDGSNIGRPQGVHKGLYILTNKQARIVMDTWGPKNKGTGQCHGYSQTYNTNIGNQLWTIQRSGNSSETCTLQNIRYCTFLELTRHPDTGVLVVGKSLLRESESRLAQEWIFAEQAPGLYTIQCAQTHTFLEIPDGNPTNTTPLTCSTAAKSLDHQVWDLQRVSRTTLEVKDSVKMWKPGLLSRLVQPHNDTAEYFVLPSQLIRTIWETTGLGSLPLQRGMFDYDDFVIKAKDAVKSWARKSFPHEQDRYSVLFGIVYGEATRGPKAYNWYLTQDMSSLLFLDAQTGREYTTAALDGFEFEPNFILL